VPIKKSRPRTEGIDKVWINGRLAWDNGELRHQTVGQVIRCLKSTVHQFRPVLWAGFGEQQKLCR
ncbi:hypothetical protein, partial [Klebsiella quasipneumoniae]|uniref:hypothetical protein n=1 Tax=Klebsiella quasipneumoniae TaxID=1463165 RepID=UPI003D3101DF